MDRVIWLTAAVCALIPGLGFSQGVAASASGSAKDGPHESRIEGRVVQPGALNGIADVDVSVGALQGDGAIVSVTNPPLQVAFTRTRADGSFSCPLPGPGKYMIRVERTGYSPVSDSTSYPSTTMLTVKENSIVGNLNLYLSLPGEVTGRVIDRDTGTPLSGVRLSVQPLRYFAYGRRGTFPGPHAVTRDDGTFTAGNLPPGEYVVIPTGKFIGTEQVVKDFKEGDQNIVEEDLERTVWPGGGDLEAAVPLDVPGGNSVSVGTLALHRVPNYRVLVKPMDAACSGEARLWVEIRPMPAVEIPCGQPILMRGWPRGSYEVD